MSKKSFILHIDSLSILDELSDEQSGKLFKAIYNFQIDNNIELEPLIKIAFLPFKNQFIRDNDKFTSFVDKQKANGSKGGRPSKNPKEPKKPKPFSENPTKPKKAYNDSDSINDNVSINKNDIKERKLKFASTLSPFLPKYGKDFMNEFYKYWTEPNKSNTKFRQELEKFWDLEKRLSTWDKNQKIKPNSELAKTSTPKYTTLEDLNKPIV